VNETARWTLKLSGARSWRRSIKNPLQGKKKEISAGWHHTLGQCAMVAEAEWKDCAGAAKRLWGRGGKGGLGGGASGVYRGKKRRSLSNATGLSEGGSELMQACEKGKKSRRRNRLGGLGERSRKSVVETRTGITQQPQSKNSCRTRPRDEAAEKKEGKAKKYFRAGKRTKKRRRRLP